MKEAEGSIPLLCDWWSYWKFQNVRITKDCPQPPALGHPSEPLECSQKTCDGSLNHSEYLYCHRLITSPKQSSNYETRQIFHTDCSADIVFPTFSIVSLPLHSPLHPFCSSLGCESVTEVIGKQLSRILETKKKKSLTRKCICFKTFASFLALLNWMLIVFVILMCKSLRAVWL